VYCRQGRSASVLIRLETPGRKVASSEVFRLSGIQSVGLRTKRALCGANGLCVLPSLGLLAVPAGRSVHQVASHLRAQDADEMVLTGPS
jgi:hypothetical protein